MKKKNRSAVRTENAGQTQAHPVWRKKNEKQDSFYTYQLADHHDHGCRLQHPAGGNVSFFRLSPGRFIIRFRIRFSIRFILKHSIQFSIRFIYQLIYRFITCFINRESESAIEHAGGQSDRDAI